MKGGGSGVGIGGILGWLMAGNSSPTPISKEEESTVGRIAENRHARCRCRLLQVLQVLPARHW